MPETTSREKTHCLNCHREYDKSYAYCPYCGQENKKFKLGFKYILSEFLAGSLNIDSKFVKSFEMLITRPAFLTEEFLKGRRASYLSPMRIYLLASLVYFTVYSLTGSIFAPDKTLDAPVATEVQSRPSDTLSAAYVLPDTAETIPGIERKKLKYYLTTKEGMKTFSREFDKYVSAVMFFIIPVAAWFLYLYFGKRRKNYYYENLIFMVHLQSLGFLVMAVMDLLLQVFNSPWLDALNDILILVTLYFWLKKFYSFGWLRALVNTVLFYFTYYFVVAVFVGLLSYISLLIL